jgi:hypothetical protein
MHIIALITTIAVAIFWISRAIGASRNIASDVSGLANLPRQRRFKKAYGKSGYELVETPVEAATVLMISTARMGEYRGISEAEIAAITLELETKMQLSADKADGTYRQMYGLVHEITLPESALFPMIDLLKSDIEREDAADLAAMLERVASCENPATPEQLEFIRRYKERMGLLH